jgi:hypothetical protein
MEAADSESPAPQTTRSLDWWFRALDQCRIKVGAQHWPALVTGIHMDGGDLWIQIAHADDPEQGLVLHLSQAAALDWVSAGTRAWTAQDPHPRVVSVT